MRIGVRARMGVTLALLGCTPYGRAGEGRGLLYRRRRNASHCSDTCLQPRLTRDAGYLCMNIVRFVFADTARSVPTYVITQF